jgi:cyclophilin family peptidyl-prolyl cis-trans isomerase
MPKTKKRAAARRAAKIARAHASQLPKLEVKEARPGQRRPGYKPPARGIARYPWATGLSVLIIALGIYTLYYYHVGPFAPPKVHPMQPKPTPTLITASPAGTSLCLKVVKQLTDTAPAPSTAEIQKITHSYKQAPAMTIDTKKIYCAGLNTNRGLIVVEMKPELAPKTVNNFVFLAQHHFYDGLTFHRVVPKFVIQGGDPQGNGKGGPGYSFADEPVRGTYTAGAVAMANNGPNTNGSQFFICTVDDTAQLRNSYNLFGYVVKGMDVVQKIQGPNPADPATKNSKPDVMEHVIIVPAP